MLSTVLNSDTAHPTDSIATQESKALHALSTRTKNTKTTLTSQLQAPTEHTITKSKRSTRKMPTHTTRDDAFTGMTLCTVPEASPRLGTAPIRADVRRNANALTTHENLPTTRTTELNNMTIDTLRNNVSIKRANNDRTQDSQLRLNQLQQSNQHHTLRTTSTTNLDRTWFLQLLQLTNTTSAQSLRSLRADNQPNHGFS
jgi:hypothetical protein